MAESNKPSIELGIEFVVELLLFLYPYGAEQMNLPHNFWLGLGCWAMVTAIAIRMFWIFPAWSHRLSRLEKGLFAFTFVALFVLAFHGPVVTAYRKHGEETTKPTEQPPAESKEGPDQPTLTNPPTVAPTAAKAVKKPSVQKGSSPAAPKSTFNQDISGDHAVGYQAEQMTINQSPPDRDLKFTQEQRDQLCEVPAMVHVFATSNEEPFRLARKIADMLAGCNWQIYEIGTINYPSAVNGIWVTSKAENDPIAAELRDALSAKLRVREDMSPGWGYSVIVGANKPNDKDDSLPPAISKNTAGYVPNH